MREWDEGIIRCRNTREPLLRVAGDPILDDLLVMETSTDSEGGQKGKRGEGCVGDGDPTGGEGNGRNLVACVVWRGHEGEGQGRGVPVNPRTSSCFQALYNSLHHRRRHPTAVGTRTTGQLFGRQQHSLILT